MPDALPGSLPLSEVDPESLDVIFSMNPDELEPKHLEKIVERLRAERDNWEKEEEAKKSSPRGKKTVAPPDLSLKDLGLA